MKKTRTHKTHTASPPIQRRRRRSILGTSSFLLSATIVAAAGCSTSTDSNVRSRQQLQSLDKAATLAYLQDAPNRTTGRVALGHFAGYSSATFTMDEVNFLGTATGHAPKIIGCDYMRWDNGSPTSGADQIDYACNAGLETHYDAGGMVAVSLHLPNPTLSGASTLDDVNTNGAPEGSLTPSSTVMTEIANFETGTSTASTNMKAILDQVAAGLLDLQNTRGVNAILFRPYHEMNGGWFWWGAPSENADPSDPAVAAHIAAFKLLWQNTHSYFTGLGLTNLIWVYSPDANREHVDDYYPGSSVVDVTALDHYRMKPEDQTSDKAQPVYQQYLDMLALGKPFGFAEAGTYWATPKDPAIGNGNEKPHADAYDFIHWGEAMEHTFTDAAFLMLWDERYGPYEQLGAGPMYTNTVMDTLSPTAWPAVGGPDDLIVEAEDGTISGVTKQQKMWGFSGSGYVGRFENASYVQMDFTVPSAGAGTRELKVRYQSPWDPKNNKVIVDGGTPQSVTFTKTDGWNEISVGTHSMTAGTHTVKIEKESGWFFVDSLIVVGADPGGNSQAVIPAGVCVNGVQDASSGETGIDCGGGICEACDDGVACSLDTDCISGSCSGGVCATTATCGDSTLQKGEQCDETSNACSSCYPTSCSDGILNNNETSVDCGGDSCAPCGGGGTGGTGGTGGSTGGTGGSTGGTGGTGGTAAFCGDGNIDAGEECDDGNSADNDGCSSVCVTEFCGDSTVQSALGEQCDDGNTNDLDACNNSCIAATCTDGVQNNGETGVDCGGICSACGGGPVSYDHFGTCYPACQGTDTGQYWGYENGANCIFPSAGLNTCGGGGSYCGDGTVDAGEQCDDGNTNNLDACSNNCVTATCSDGVQNNGETGTDCGGTCSACSFCGDGTVDAGEQCDDGNTNDLDACSNNCIAATCSDGIQNQSETGVDCGGPCTACGGFCGDGTVDAGEQCDDGNTNQTDFCNNSCISATCSDGVQNGNETGVDCGGSCGSCGGGGGCLTITQSDTTVDLTTYDCVTITEPFSKMFEVDHTGCSFDVTVTGGSVSKNFSGWYQPHEFNPWAGTFDITNNSTTGCNVIRVKYY